ncbi:metallophosphoesterase [Bacteroidota bacterium]
MKLRLLKTIPVLILFVLITGCKIFSPAITNTKWEKPFTFIQMTDPQFGMESKNKNFILETELFEKAITSANKINPSFVVVSGDLVNKENESKQIAEYFRISTKLNKSIPLYNIPGNHDVYKDPTTETINNYKRKFGKDYYTFIKGGCFFICLNSTIFQNPEQCIEERDKQFKWLEKTLKRSKDYHHTFIVMHHPLFLEEYDEPDQYFNMPTEIRMKYLKLFKKFNIKAIFAGHYHQNSYGKYENMEMITCCSVGKPFADDPSGFNIVKVFKDRIEFEYRGLE